MIGVWALWRQGPDTPDLASIDFSTRYQFLTSYPATEEIRTSPPAVELWESILGGEPFSLRVESSGFGFTSDSIEIDSSGRLTYIWDSEPHFPSAGSGVMQRPEQDSHWRRIAFDLSPEQKEELRQLVGEGAVMELADSYRSSILDGDHLSLSVASGPWTKEVWCDNHFPLPVVRLCELLDEFLGERDKQKYPVEYIESKEPLVLWQGRLISWEEYKRARQLPSPPNSP